ncbi:uncharacterized protein LOC131157137 isoform X3 [Malania oleifera]|uniref:uncharacterized protein LOC131157137 isoform X3 n=1 Tax=Malania oleifera TaxID=397392 RepID=UPI0025AE44FE|nr:uncharacterized protein LOC131157137 isoform X3 [Malania oleifera]
MGGEPAEEVEEEEEEKMRMVKIGSYGGLVRLLVAIDGECTAAAEETMLLWGIQQPTLSKPNAFARQSSIHLHLDACGHSLSILQSPSSLSTPGVTGAVMWDSGVVLGKFLEHAADTGMLLLQGRKVIELGSGCGLVGVRLLKKNVDANLGCGHMRGSGTVCELIWGDDPDPALIDPMPDYVLGSDVIYNEGAVVDLLATLLQLCGAQTTVFLAGELRNDAVLEYFLEAAMKDFMVGRVDQGEWHPDYHSQRVVMYVLVKK